jgi:hypothetical protein
MLGEAGDCSEGLLRERLAEDGTVLEDPALVCRQSVQAGGDQRMQRLWNLEHLDRAGRAVDRFLLDQRAAVEQHPHGLDRVQGNTLGTLEDLMPKRLGKTRDEPGEQLLHGRLRQRLEVDRREVPARGSPGRPTLLQLRPRQGHDEERRAPRPIEQVLDEVEERGVRPLHVLEDHDRRVDVGEALEEEAPGGEQVLPLEPGVLLQPEQMAKARLDEAPLLLVRQVLLDDLRQLRQR